MAARFIDAAEGWGIYRQHQGEISLPEINEALRERGYRAVSNRMYRHYERLRRFGYSEYLSINRLDLRHATDSVFDVADRSRYMSRDLVSPATLHIPTATDLVELAGQVVAISEDAATFVTDDPEPLVTAGKSKKYNRGVLRFYRVGVERAVEVKDVATRDSHARAVLQFRSLLAVDTVIDEDRPSSRSELRVDLGQSPWIFDVMAIWRRSFDLIEASRAIAEATKASLPEEHRQPTAATRILRVRMESPFEIDSLTDPIALAVLLYIYRYVRTEVAGAIEIIAARRGIRHADSDEARRRERHEFDLQSGQLDDLKKALEIESLLADLDAPIRAQLEIDDTVPIQPTAARIEALKNQAIEAAVELMLSSDGQFTVRPTEESAPADSDTEPEG